MLFFPANYNMKMKWKMRREMTRKGGRLIYKGCLWNAIMETGHSRKKIRLPITDTTQSEKKSTEKLEDQEFGQN